MVPKDSAIYHYSAPNFFGDVVYQDDQMAFENEFSETIDVIKNKLSIFYECNVLDMKDYHTNILSMFLHLKNRAFFEEREVRFTAFPMTREIENEFRRMEKTYTSPDKPMKEIFLRNDESRGLTLSQGE